MAHLGRYFPLYPITDSLSRRINKDTGLSPWAIAVYSPNAITNKSNTDTITFTQSIHIILSPAISQSLSFAQTIILVNNTYNRSADDTLTFTQTLHFTFPISISQSVTFAQVEIDLEIYLRSISQSIIFTHNITYELDSANRPAINSIVLVQSVDLHGSYVRLITQSITFSQALHLIQFANQSITFSQSLTHKMVYHKSLTNTLIFTHTLSSHSIFTSHITDILFFNDPYIRTIQIGNIEFGIPNTTYILVPRKCRVVLGVPNVNIVLPCPLFGDSQANTSTFVTKRTMAGDTFTYVKQSELQMLKYNFQVTTGKALELRNFVRNNLSNLITLSNWKAENWLVYFANNPVDNITQSLASPTDEYINVSLEFEGLKVAG